MVTSISVALIKKEDQYGLPVSNISLYIVVCAGWIRRVADAVIVGKTDEDVPEGAQQPVIDDLEEACHGNGSLICPESSETMAMASLAACLAVQSLRIIPRWLVWPGPWLSLRTGGKKSQREAGTLPLLS